jgi:hypothetical protein
MLEEMKPLLVKAGIKEDYLVISDPECSEGHNWLLTLYHGPYAKAKKVRSLLTEEMWARYESWGDFGGCQEVVLWNKVATDLRKFVKTRPNSLKKVKNEAADQDSQSQEA